MKIFHALTLTILPAITQAAICSMPIEVNKALVREIAAMARGSENAQMLQERLGPACACVPLTPTPSDTWMCQWKGDLSSNRLINTLNITFEAGMLAQVVGVDKEGEFIHAP
ncbi:hypothetical protein E3226_009805 [Legionella geestiana]|uniref:hypothetical protein n=1 Tax=Legionella geestiana TaxID=45065 RepID=UPI00109296CF|nr:hypothetical protein [Legionella geestiana]QDQ40666.1 hypothetical protein E3226_009805 [Legionella geestiana]